MCCQIGILTAFSAPGMFILLHRMKPSDGMFQDLPIESFKADCEDKSKLPQLLAVERDGGSVTYAWIGLTQAIKKVPIEVATYIVAAGESGNPLFASALENPVIANWIAENGNGKMKSEKYNSEFYAKNKPPEASDAPKTSQIDPVAPPARSVSLEHESSSRSDLSMSISSFTNVADSVELARKDGSFKDLSDQETELFSSQEASQEVIDLVEASGDDSSCKEDDSMWDMVLEACASSCDMMSISQWSYFSNITDDHGLTDWSKMF